MTDALIPDDHLGVFVNESNRIEGIERYPTEAELRATLVFIGWAEPTVEHVESLVSVLQPDAVLRRRRGLNVRVGGYFSPAGGPDIEVRLIEILRHLPFSDPWHTHIAYERLHPFTDGNGRSGRALWAWQIVRRQRGLPLGFLHQWYYSTLERASA